MKLNLGCGNVLFEDDWLNVDIKTSENRLESHQHRSWDLKEKLPLSDCSVSLIFSSHFLEHLDPQTEVKSFLDECKRVLRPNHPIRIVVPDLAAICRIYQDDPRKFYADYGYNKPWFSRGQGWSRRLGISIMYGHKMIYDHESISEVLLESGFSGIRSCSHDHTDYIAPSDFESIVHTHVSHSLFVEAVRG